MIGHEATAGDPKEPNAWRRVARPELAVAGLLLAAAAAAWASTAVRMTGMDAGLWMYPTDFGFYISTWVVMMAAMMLPSIVPAVLTYERAARGHRGRWMAFATTCVLVAAYLAVWSAAGLVAYALLRMASAVDGGLFAGAIGRYVAAGVLLAAVAYELAPSKRACLDRCCAPLTFLREGGHASGTRALRLGLASGVWCLGCCWALMAALFALGLMGLTWMILITVLIAAEKLLPARRLTTLGVAVILTALAIGLVVGAPISTLPGHGGAPM